MTAGVLPVVELGDTRRNQRLRADHLQQFIDSRTFGRPESRPDTCVPTKTPQLNRPQENRN
jgi:hypothetical protein